MILIAPFGPSRVRILYSVMTLMVAIIGATFAYFTATVTETGETDQNVTIQTAVNS